jgi:hypothetical protein
MLGPIPQTGIFGFDFAFGNRFGYVITRLDIARTTFKRLAISERQVNSVAGLTWDVEGRAAGGVYRQICKLN